MAGLVDKIKSDVKRSGSNKGKLLYVREGQKVRVRFLNDMDEGLDVKFHDSYAKGVNVPCQELFGRACAYCEDEDLRTRSLYAWSVWDYESKEVKIFMFAVNNCSPIPALMAMYENYGTLTDRDYVISVSGQQQNKTYSVVPMDKVKFRNDKAKAFSKKAILDVIDKAFPAEESQVEDDDDDDAVEETTNSYEDMSAKDLYKLCIERDIDVEKKKPEKYYINALKEADKAKDDWGDDSSDEDEWEDE